MNKTDAFMISHINPRLFNAHLASLEALKLYHRHEIHGTEHIPKEGRAIVAANHSAATYDLMILRETLKPLFAPRRIKGIADHLFFRFDWLADLAMRSDAIEGRPSVAGAVLEEDNIIFVAPGGMAEALRPKEQRYEIHWEQRQGFCKLAVKEQAPIILVACPNADDIYTLYDSKLTQAAYKRLRLPIPLMRGVGLTIIPKPVKLVHLVRKPLYPPVWSEEEGEDALFAKTSKFHTEVCQEMQTLMRQALHMY